MVSKLSLFACLFLLGCPPGQLDTDGTKQGGGSGAADGSGGAADGANTAECPDTAACGCSNKNKDDCGGSCCRWTVGEGCGCAR
jgi:hypothetical protein